VEITTGQLDEYQLWLRKYGRSASTANEYALNVRRAYEQGGPFERLTNTDLSPKYLQLIKAALKSWAEFNEDESLIKELRKVRLPAALRMKDEVPLTQEEWKALRGEINTATYLKEPVRAELGLLACRGIRCNGALRVKRTEVIEALRKGVLDYECKGRKRLKASVAPSWREYLEILADHKDWERAEDLVCPRSPPGKQRHASSAKKLARSLNRCGSEIGLNVDDLHPHLLRHTYATLYYEKCRDPKKLLDHMGWSDIKIAMNYVGSSSKEDLDGIADSLFEDDGDDE